MKIVLNIKDEAEAKDIKVIIKCGFVFGAKARREVVDGYSKAINEYYKPKSLKIESEKNAATFFFSKDHIDIEPPRLKELTLLGELYWKVERGKRLAKETIKRIEEEKNRNEKIFKKLEQVGRILEREQYSKMLYRSGF